MAAKKPIPKWKDIRAERAVKEAAEAAKTSSAQLDGLFSGLPPHQQIGLHALVQPKTPPGESPTVEKALAYANIQEGTKQHDLLTAAATTNPDAILSQEIDPSDLEKTFYDAETPPGGSSQTKKSPSAQGSSVSGSSVPTESSPPHNPPEKSSGAFTQMPGAPKTLPDGFAPLSGTTEAPFTLGGTMPGPTESQKQVAPEVQRESANEEFKSDDNAKYSSAWDARKTYRDVTGAAGATVHSTVSHFPEVPVKQDAQSVVQPPEVPVKQDAESYFGSEEPDPNSESWQANENQGEWQDRVKALKKAKQEKPDPGPASGKEDTKQPAAQPAQNPSNPSRLHKPEWMGEEQWEKAGGPEHSERWAAEDAARIAQNQQAEPEAETAKERKLSSGAFTQMPGAPKDLKDGFSSVPGTIDTEFGDTMPGPTDFQKQSLPEELQSRDERQSTTIDARARYKRATGSSGAKLNPPVVSPPDPNAQQQPTQAHPDPNANVPPPGPNVPPPGPNTPPPGPSVNTPPPGTGNPTPNPTPTGRSSGGSGWSDITGGLGWAFGSSVGGPMGGAIGQMGGRMLGTLMDGGKVSGSDALKSIGSIAGGAVAGKAGSTIGKALGGLVGDSEEGGGGGGGGDSGGGSVTVSGGGVGQTEGEFGEMTRLLREMSMNIKSMVQNGIAISNLRRSGGSTI